MTRKHVLFANTQFTCVQFFPTGVQVLATGSDRKISYWEVFDGSLVRHIEGSTKGCINWLSINSSGEMFVSGGVDQIVKVLYSPFFKTIFLNFNFEISYYNKDFFLFQLWDYQTALQVASGVAHAASIVCCRFSPCGKFIVSGSTDGAVIIWKVPEVQTFVFFKFNEILHS